MKSSFLTSKWFDRLFLGLGLLVQVLTYCFAPTGLWSLVSGLCGICSVVLCAQGNILYYIFGFAQVLTYTYLCVKAHLYAEIGMNIFYFITMVYGVFVWSKNLRASGNKTETEKVHADSVAATSQSDKLTVRTRSLSVAWLVGLLVICALSSAVVGYGLANYTDDASPYLDAFTTVPALFAQVLMVLLYREQYYIWLAVNVLAFVMWLGIGDFCMATQYLFWTLNCVYGLWKWSGLATSATKTAC